MEPKVKLEKISKKYQLYQKQSDKLLDLFFAKEKRNRCFYALKNISFEVQSGESIGIIGINGSGKSTLSNLLANIMPPTSGTLKMNGEVSLIAIAAGLNNHLSGLENIELKCMMHGLRKAEIKKITPKIIEFADLDYFIEQPVKNFSSGMKARLGFAISIFIEPDILIIDEALSVGDQTFYEKCLAKINEFKAAGKTIFFISHSLAQIRSFSDRVIWLHYGEVKEMGETNDVLQKYEQFINWFNKLSNSEKNAHKNQMMKEQLNCQLEDRKSLTKVKKNHLSFISIFVLFITSLLTAFLMFIDK